MKKPLIITFSIIFVMALFGLFGKKKNESNENKHSLNIDIISFDNQVKVFEELGYKFNHGITKDDILKSSNISNGNSEDYFKEKPLQRLYYHLGWSKDYPRNYFTDNCIWYDIEFIDSSTEYIEFMKRMGVITHGEINYTNIKLSIDSENYEWLNFKVNEISKSWKLAKVGNIDDSFFQRFSYLTKELKSKGRYTYYDDGGQQFVIDYATDEEQKLFIEKTKLKREWLGEENHFSEPNS